MKSTVGWDRCPVRFSFGTMVPNYIGQWSQITVDITQPAAHLKVAPKISLRIRNLLFPTQDISKLNDKTIDQTPYEAIMQMMPTVAIGRS